MKDYTNSQITFLIDEHIHNKRDREIMKLHYVDGISADTIRGRYAKNRTVTHKGEPCGSAALSFCLKIFLLYRDNFCK